MLRVPKHGKFGQEIITASMGTGNNRRTDKLMRIWFLSDTHGRHRELEIPQADLVIYCGDESNHSDPVMNEPEARDFLDWYSELSISTRIFVPGNHSTAIEQGLIRRSDYPSIQFLVHEGIVCNGIRIFGSPYTPDFCDWAYMKARSDLDMVWQTIPDDVDILITHGPPKGILDVTSDMYTGNPIHVGSGSLMRHVRTRIRPTLHAYGHIHDEPGISNYGSVTRSLTRFLNCSCCDLFGSLQHHGMVIHYD